VAEPLDGEDAMITRHRLLKTGVGTALVGRGLPWLGAAALAQGRRKLSPLLPVGTRSEAIFDAMRGKKPLISAHPGSIAWKPAAAPATASISCR